MNPTASFWQRRKWIQHVMLRRTDQTVRDSFRNTSVSVTLKVVKQSQLWGNIQPSDLNMWILDSRKASEKGLLLTDVGLVYLSLHSKDVAQCLKSNSVKETRRRGSRLLFHDIRKHQSRRCFLKYLKITHSRLENVAWLIVITVMRVTEFIWKADFDFWSSGFSGQLVVSSSFFFLFLFCFLNGLHQTINHDRLLIIKLMTISMKT